MLLIARNSAKSAKVRWPVVPKQLPDGKWNCSVPHWTQFRPHLTCNLELECAGGEDEQGAYFKRQDFPDTSSPAAQLPYFTCASGVQHVPYTLVCDFRPDLNLYANLRYLDASDSGLGVKQLTTNRLMIFLSLSRCNLTHLDSLVLPNLRHLDLSDNHLTVINREDLLGLGNLQTLNLSECVVDRILEDGFQSLPKLRVLDLRGCPSLHVLKLMNVQRK
nr:hypothetical protein BaRGS_026965 [Batillaria attramentaria]